MIHMGFTIGDNTHKTYQIQIIQKMAASLLIKLVMFSESNNKQQITQIISSSNTHYSYKAR